jgi:hypothetical protein
VGVLRVIGAIILKPYLEKLGMKVRPGLSWLRIMFIGEIL